MTCFCILAAASASLAVASSAPAQVVIDWSTVGNAGNAADPTTGFGAVGYEYRIGTYEVTNSQYAAFLNSVAANDPNGLYNPNMGSDLRGGITRSGSDGSYTYSVRENMGDKPVNYVSWYDAARMANWMTNGQGLNGGSGDTESGVYTFTGVDSISNITRDLSNPNQVFIPTEDEWYKAAYHQVGGGANNYWLYATQSNSVPTISSATSIGDVANPGQSVVNYRSGADWNGQNGNVTTVGSAGSTSFYGAFDMNGNVGEWNETLMGSTSSSNRGVRGGPWSTDAVGLRSSFRGNGNFPTVESNLNGFRLASPASDTPPCPADTNLDGMLTPADFTAWIAAFNAMSPQCDQNGDGLCTSADFTAWIANFNAGC